MTPKNSVQPKSQAVSPPRRVLVMLGLASLLAAVARLKLPSVGAVTGDRTERVLLTTLRAGSASAVGNLVLTALPGVGSREHLVDEVLGDLGLDRHSVSSTPRAIMAARIARRVQLDFEFGRIVKVAGWRLALTEARLCALAARLASRAA